MLNCVKSYWQRFYDMREGRMLFWIFVAALVVRIIGMNYGYWHGDERVNDAAKVLAGQLVPGQHFYPPFYNYINAVFFGILFAIGRIIPVWHSVSDFKASYFSDPTAFYLTARFVCAAFGAAVAPLFYLVAKSLNFNRTQCLLAGIFGIFLPVMVLLCHISKSDIPLATASVLVIYVLLEKYKHLESIKYDVWLGFSISLAMSFKHSYVFILAPLMLGHAYLLWRASDIPATIRSLFITGLVLVPTWCVFNIGILLDLQNFIVFQKIQAQMSIREGETFWQAIAAWYEWSSHNSYGVNPIVTILFVVFPLYLNSKFSSIGVGKGILNISWISTAFATVVVIAMSGTRQHSGLWVPYFTCMQLFVAIMLLDVLRTSIQPLKLAGIATLSVSLLLSLYGSAVVWKQALVKPIADTVEEYIREGYSDRKILTSYELRLPQTKEMQEAEIARHNRIAEKYDVVMPERSEERLIKHSASDAVNHFGMPGVMFGLENADDESLKGNVKPYAWPIQKEEWFLDYWTSKGFSVFVVADHEYYKNETPAKAFRDFHTELADTCEKKMIFYPKKPFFLEATVTIFECDISAAS